ncbi:MAG: hypothetical protein JNM17_27885 [Archangium sp.]|nr:hypothetical protein [Archangium sp.]
MREHLLVFLLLLTGCRTLHENAIKTRLVQARFYGRELKKPLSEVDQFLTSRRQDAVKTWCELCVASAETIEGGKRKYCLSARGENACVVAEAVSPTSMKFEALEKPSSPMVARVLWWTFDPEGAQAADSTDQNELSRLAYEEEEDFTPRWTFLAGAKAGTVISYDPPTFTFGGQAGFRYWGSIFVIPGAAIEIENMLQAGRSMVQGHLQGRIELALWSDENTRFFNLPRLTFLMGGGPLVGFGRTPALGGRAVLGIHLDHLGSFITPFFFELGFQVLDVDEQTSSGLRIALGLGL